MTCACGDGKLCAEHLGQHLDRSEGRFAECLQCGHESCRHPREYFNDPNRACLDCDCGYYVASSWRSFPVEPTCERCIVKVEGGYIHRKCEDCHAKDRE